MFHIGLFRRLRVDPSQGRRKRIKLTNWKCGGCGVIYSFEEWMTLQRVPAVVDDPDPKKNYGYTMVCKHCGYVFHKDKPVWKGYGEIEHHITSLHWLVNKLTHGRLAAPHLIDIELSTVFLELAHDDYDFGSGKREPNWYESMFFCHREGERTLDSPKFSDEEYARIRALPLEERVKLTVPEWTEGKPKVECWIQQRYRTEEQAIEGHERWLRLFEAGRYLITYAFEKIDWSDPDSKYRVEWRLDFDERHRRILHGAKLSREMEGTVQEYTMEARGVEQKGTVI